MCLVFRGEGAAAIWSRLKIAALTDITPQSTFLEKIILSEAHAIIPKKNDTRGCFDLRKKLFTVGPLRIDAFSPTPQTS